MRILNSAAALCVALSLFATGCSDSGTDPDDSGNNSTAITGEYYTQAKINGTYETQQSKSSATETITPGYESSTGGANSGSGYVVAQRSFFSRVVSGAGGIPALDPTYRSISIIAIRNYIDEPPKSLYSQIMHQGEMPFGSYSAEENGVEIMWRDAAGTIWSTAYGTGDQTGSSFTVSSYTPISVPQGQPVGAHYKAVGTFSATLYDGKGNSMPITDGKFTIQTVYY